MILKFFLLMLVKYFKKGHFQSCYCWGKKYCKSFDKSYFTAILVEEEIAKKKMFE